MQKAILDNVFALGRAQLSESLLNESNPLGHQRLSRLKSIFEGGKSLQLQFPAEDLGFRYQHHHHLLNCRMFTQVQRVETRPPGQSAFVNCISGFMKRRFWFLMFHCVSYITFQQKIFKLRVIKNSNQSWCVYSLGI